MKKKIGDCFFDIGQFCSVFTSHGASNRKLGPRLI